MLLHPACFTSGVMYDMKHAMLLEQQNGRLPSTSIRGTGELRVLQSGSANLSNDPCGPTVYGTDRNPM